MFLKLPTKDGLGVFAGCTFSKHTSAGALRFEERIRGIIMSHDNGAEMLDIWRFRKVDLFEARAEDVRSHGSYGCKDLSVRPRITQTHHLIIGFQSEGRNISHSIQLTLYYLEVSSEMSNYGVVSHQRRK